LKSPRDSLEDIQQECRFLSACVGRLTLDSFLDDEVMKRAFARSIEIIGEAVKAIPDTFVAEHPQIPWRRMAGMRDRLIHGYFAVDYALFWNVATKHIGELDAGIASILTSLTKD
jgi:uncharacterized protein with HEPN domain